MSKFKVTQSILLEFFCKFQLVRHVIVTVCATVFPVTAVTVSLDGWERTVTWTGMTVCLVPARMLAHALTSLMASPASVAKASEVRVWDNKSTTAVI